MRKVLSLALAALLGSAALAWADTWTGYITDTHCGKNGASKDHTARCVEKCMKSGSKAQIFNEADGKIVNLDGIDKVKALVGARVTVTGTLDAKTNTITVETAEKAK